MEGGGCNAGVSCRGLLVVDCDGVHGPTRLETLFDARGGGPPSAAVKAGGGGLHFYFRLPDGASGPGHSAGRLAEGVDTKSKGGVVVGPPSVHESGKRYRWLTPDGEPPPLDGLPLAPSWLLALLVKPSVDACAAGGPPEVAPGGCRCSRCRRRGASG